jgi:hypothetical protein
MIEKAWDFAWEIEAAYAAAAKRDFDPLAATVIAMILLKRPPVRGNGRPSARAKSDEKAHG